MGTVRPGASSRTETASADSLAIERLRDLVGTVLDPRVHRALQAVVARREALIFLDDGRG